MVLSNRNVVRAITPFSVPVCGRCGGELEYVDSYASWKCPNGCHPDNY